MNVAPEIQELVHLDLQESNPNPTLSTVLPFSAFLFLFGQSDGKQARNVAPSPSHDASFPPGQDRQPVGKQDLQKRWVQILVRWLKKEKTKQWDDFSMFETLSSHPHPLVTLSPLGNNQPYRLLVYGDHVCDDVAKYAYIRACTFRVLLSILNIAVFGATLQQNVIVCALCISVSELI